MDAHSGAGVMLRELLATAQSLSDDIDFTAVKRWKESGRKAVGHMPTYVPRELIHAAGMLPVGITGGGASLEIIRGDAYFQSYICRIPRSTIELALSHRLDILDGMLFPSICDVIRNLSGMWSMLFPDRYVHYVDVPQNFDEAVGGRFWRRELETLRRDFEELAGTTITDDALRASIAVYNENRRAIRDLYRARSGRPWIFPMSESYLLLRAGNVLPPDEHTAMIREYLALAPSDSERRDQDRSRVVLSGMFCEQPPHGLVLTLERAGCYVVVDDFLIGLRWLQQDVSTSGDPLDNLVDAYLHHSAMSASRYAPEGDRGRWLVESVERNEAEGVVFCAPSFCDPALLDQPMLVAALDRKGIPHTEFKYSEDTGQFAVIREQAGTFSDSIRLWSEA
ncbi:MAG TPA: benzoyl-CoA reductase subunit C [Thermoanaerobaculia bacterium]|nr:benzoyl-CoA reductase subunit C [Thermoanaerobaculia bacterium]